MRRILCCVLLLLLAWPLCAQSENAVATLSEFAAAFFAHAERLETSFEIPCTPALMEQLFGDSLLAGYPLFHEITSNCGVLTLSYARRSRSISVTSVQYYEGMRILHAYRSGQTASLGIREQQTLKAALDLTAGVSGTDLEKERQLHDLLCARVTYYTNELTSMHQDHDCAIGALLNGKADCDGYADAFYLLGSLAGLQVRYQHGSTVLRSEAQTDPTASKKDETHMWNTVRIGGQWLMLDVTWDDSDADVSYVYFNNGQDRHLLTHVWDDRALAFSVAATAGSGARPEDLRYHTVTAWDDVYPLLRGAADSRLSRICLSYPDSFDLSRQRQALSDAIYAMGVIDYQWGFGGHCAELHALSYAEHFQICDTEQDILDYIDQCAKGGVHEFSLYFYPPLDQRLFSQDHQPLIDLLAQSRLLEITYKYNEQSGRVRVTDAQYLSRVSFLRTQADILTFLRTKAQLHSASIIFYTSLSLPLETFTNPLYSMGVISLSWGEKGGRYTFSNLQYYPEFRIISDTQEVNEYLLQCRRYAITNFRLYCAPAAYLQLMSDQGSALFSLLRQMGVDDCSVSYNADYGMIAVENVRWQ